MRSLAFVAAVLVMLFAYDAHAIYGVQDAINDALSDNLKYVGKFIPHGSESGKRPICVYRGSKVVVYSSYCVKYAVGAANIRIHSIDPSKGSLQVYAEAQNGDDITKVKRDHYSDYGFYIATYDTKDFDFHWPLAKLKAYDTKLALAPRPACLSSRTSPKSCTVNHAGNTESWGGPASQFWDKPTENWYQLIKLMKSKVP